MEARNLVSQDSIDREEIIKKAVRERHPRRAGIRKKGSNADHAAMYAGDGAGDGHGGRSLRWGNRGWGGRGTNEDGGGSAVAAGGDSSSAKSGRRLSTTIAKGCYRRC